MDDQLRLNELEVDQENIGQNQIGNPIIRRPKGRPPGTATLLKIHLILIKLLVGEIKINVDYAII